MAQRSAFKQRFPYAGLFFLMAITIAIPITVWSLNNVSTQTKQQAATRTPRVVLYDCLNFETNSTTCQTKTYYGRYNNITGKWVIGVSNLGTYDNWSDKTASLKVIDFIKGTSIRFYQDGNFSGTAITVFVEDSYIAEKIPDLRKFWPYKWFDGFADQITSFKSL